MPIHHVTSICTPPAHLYERHKASGLSGRQHIHCTAPACTASSFSDRTPTQSASIAEPPNLILHTLPLTPYRDVQQSSRNYRPDTYRSLNPAVIVQITQQDVSKMQNIREKLKRKLSMHDKSGQYYTQSDV